MSLLPRLALTLALAALSVAASSAVESDALRRRAQERQSELEGSFTVEVETPFVVIGDEPAAVVRSRARQVVRWTVLHLKKAYFARDPDDVIEIWLFRDRASYVRNLRERFGEAPVSPYGFYSRRHEALFMNIELGAGTLVHEIVHPFMRANFPACPAWFNEGLASLYEQCGEESGRMVGRVNWRLPGLQERIKQGTVLPFERLMALSTIEFYGESEGYSIHYGQSRYLCYYLQEHGLLRRYYAEFVADAADDPTGYRTLQRMLGVEDMAAFQREWEAFVLRLRFPE